MTDEETTNVIQLHSDNKQKLIKDMLTKAFEYVHERADVQEAVLIVSSKNAVATFNTPIRDPFVFIALTEMIKYKIISDNDHENV